MDKFSAKGTVARWTLLTMLGLTAGIGAGSLLDKPIEAVVGMVLVTPIVTLLAGAALGTSQWFQLRLMKGKTRMWILATCLGLGIGLALGVVTVETLGRLITGHRPRLFHLNASERALSFAALGLITGFSVGTAQWLIVLRRTFHASHWVKTSTVSLGVAFAISSLIADWLVGGVGTPVGAITFLILAGLLFGLGTARPLVRAT